MVPIAIISDTHLPRGGRRLPDACLERLAIAELIIHAGDCSTPAVIEQLRSYGPVVAVHGNADDAAIRAEFPDRIEVDVDGVRIGIVHNGGPAAGRLERLRRRFPGCAAVIFGHSHLPLLERDPDDGFQIFNPGSATDKRRQPRFTMGWAAVEDGAIRFELIDLGSEPATTS